MNAIQLDHLKKRRGGFTLAIEQLSVPTGGIMGIAGHNGAGKSTLLSLMALLDPPDAGSIRLFGVPVEARNGRHFLAQRRDISLLLQETVLFSLTVRENIAYGLRLRRMAEAQIRRRVDAVMEELALTPLADRRATELSGGEAHRAAFARAIVLPAKLYLFDEPGTNADPASTRLMEAAISRLPANGATVIFSTLDERRIERLATDRITLENGRIVA